MTHRLGWVRRLLCAQVGTVLPSALAPFLILLSRVTGPGLLGGRALPGLVITFPDLLAQQLFLPWSILPT